MISLNNLFTTRTEGTKETVVQPRQNYARNLATMISLNNLFTTRTPGTKDTPGEVETTVENKLYIPDSELTESNGLIHTYSNSFMEKRNKNFYENNTNKLIEGEIAHQIHTHLFKDDIYSVYKGFFINDQLYKIFFDNEKNDKYKKNNSISKYLDSSNYKKGMYIQVDNNDKKKIIEKFTELRYDKDKFETYFKTIENKKKSLITKKKNYDEIYNVKINIEDLISKAAIHGEKLLTIQLVPYTFSLTEKYNQKTFDIGVIENKESHNKYSENKVDQNTKTVDFKFTDIININYFLQTKKDDIYQKLLTQNQNDGIIDETIDELLENIKDDFVVSKLITTLELPDSYFKDGKIKENRELNVDYIANGSTDWKRGKLIGISHIGDNYSFIVQPDDKSEPETIKSSVTDVDKHFKIFFPFKAWFFPHIDFSHRSIKLKKLDDIDKVIMRANSIDIDEDISEKTNSASIVGGGNVYFKFSDNHIIPKQIPTYLTSDKNELTPFLSETEKEEKKKFVDAPNNEELLEMVVKDVDKKQKPKTEAQQKNEADRVVELNTLFEKSLSPEGCNEQEMIEMLQLSELLRTADIPGIDVNYKKMIQLSYLKAKTAELSKKNPLDITAKELNSYNEIKKNVEDKVKKLEEEGADKTDSKKILLETTTQFRDKLKDVEILNPDEFNKSNIQIKEIEEEIKDKNEELDTYTKTVNKKISKQKTMEKLNNLMESEDGNMSVVTKILEEFIISTIKTANLRAGTTFEETAVNMVSFLNRQSKDCEKMWLEYEKLSSKTGANLVEEKNKFLRNNKDKIFKCLETNKFGEIFHLLDGYYESIDDEDISDKNNDKIKENVAKQKNTATDLQSKLNKSNSDLINAEEKVEVGKANIKADEANVEEGMIKKIYEEGIRTSVAKQIFTKIIQNV